MRLINFLVSAILISTQSIAKPFERGIATLNLGRAPLNVPVLGWKDNEVEKAIHSKRLLLVLDYHGTLMGHDVGKQDHPKLEKILMDISKTSDLVISSGGPAKELLGRFNNIPHLTISAELGVEVLFQGKVIKTAPTGTQEQVQRIKKICEEVSKSKSTFFIPFCLLQQEIIAFADFLETQLNRDRHIKDNQFEPYPDRLYSHRVHFGNQLDLKSMVRYFQTVKQRIQDEGLKDWLVELPSSQTFLSIRLADKDKTDLTKTLIENAIAEGHEFDYVIGMGDGEIDEPLLEYLNRRNFLSILVHNAFHKRVNTFAQFRLPDVDGAQALLQHIAAERIKRMEVQGSVLT
ncbi:uncharacterized protein MELLADRAFT_111171 [Melampsora larici-populina 98AG31]|uniref:Trehalose 6-phosphate phosphatase n=1 Tax=Melampsora larici-populina (strain 98AG31 / pathotype 3-4-7) TaxID=747676 RepID=F4S295_MELLP|nr:uncharacterized protein MELLADRAFT_111171 [Melampsora larici-populina 98AG31]EGG01242.1 hypothetical protein MELLADRAFT_111171 [Melampsora larici-populina 98AG31]